jgi:phage baseplate assembly protein W
MAMGQYLRLPLDMSKIFEVGHLKTCTLKESIARNLHLLITTGLGENKQDSEYGSRFWDFDYDIHLSNDARREIIVNAIRHQIHAYEKRLTDVSVDVYIKQTEYHADGRSQVRRRIELIISGIMVRNSEEFSFQTAFFIGPLLFD